MTVFSAKVARGEERAANRAKVRECLGRKIMIGLEPAGSANVKWFVASIWILRISRPTHPRGRVIACTLLTKLISTQKTFSLSFVVMTRHLEPTFCCRQNLVPFSQPITFHAPDDHQDDMPPPCPPHHVFSVYVSWPVSRQSEPLIPDTDENRLSACVTGRPRPPRRLHL